MKRFKEIDLEAGMPTSADALTLLKSSITNAKSGNIGCLYVIHGYGSSGKGGVIRDKVRQWLHAQARNGTVKAVINGEDFTIFNFKALELKNKYRELEPLLKVCNHGVTVVEL
ncbi:MAG: Smr/MutS family protein [Clostridia bacterium]|nr:Smr/MutS family protein [Clostridia bacterium]